MLGTTRRSLRHPARLLHFLPPETAHRLGLRLLALRPTATVRASPALAVDLAGLRLAHPVGLAAGFDKNAEAIGGAIRAGFAFVEIGTVTRRAQTGNPRPRVFRLPDEEAVINRLGFNNDGIEAVVHRLARTRPANAVIGGNIGINRDSKDPAADYASCLARLAPHVDYLTVNVSSPNTPGLRALQAAERLHGLLLTILGERDRLAAESGHRRPVFLKIAPDLDADAEAGIAEVATALALDGLIVGNTTLDRPLTLTSPAAPEAGGLSGRPLFPRSTRLLARFALRLEGRIPLIGVGGIASGSHAYAKIRAGATAVQLYTALIYEGPSLIGRIVRDLDTLLARDGLPSLDAARGLDADRLATARLDRRQHVI